MRLIFLFTQQGAGAKGTPYDPSVKTKNHFASDEGLKTEGYMWLLHRMKETKTVDEILVFIESNRWPGQTEIYGIPIHVVPHLDCVDSYIKPKDVIWVRGGFRSWHNWLVKRKNHHWLLLYAANTGRERWDFWDVVFNDVGKTGFIDKRGRTWLDFHKPIHPKVFYPMLRCKPEYDICIGASHIHDKKGQWKTINAIIEYEKIRNKKLKCVMPGRIMRGSHTAQIVPLIKQHELNVTLPGMVPRSRVNEYYNKSKLFVYLGGGGQNDRGPLEALRCGTQVMICNPPRHHKVVYQEPAVSHVSTASLNPVMVADELHILLDLWKPEDRKHIFTYFEKENGIENVCLPEMGKLFEVISRFPEPTLEAKKALI